MKRIWKSRRLSEKKWDCKTSRVSFKQNKQIKPPFGGFIFAPEMVKYNYITNRKVIK